MFKCSKDIIWNVFDVAIEKVLPRSPVFVFTDADAKDSYRFNELIRAVKAKDIRLELFISNECARRRNADKDKGSKTM